MNKKEQEIIKSINIILKDIRKNALSKTHRHDEINIDCGECKFRIFEGYLEWYKDLLEWNGGKPKLKNEKVLDGDLDEFIEAELKSVKK